MRGSAPCVPRSGRPCSEHAYRHVDSRVASCSALIAKKSVRLQSSFPPGTTLLVHFRSPTRSIFISRTSLFVAISGTCTDSHSPLVVEVTQAAKFIPVKLSTPAACHFFARLFQSVMRSPLHGLPQKHEGQQFTNRRRNGEPKPEQVGEWQDTGMQQGQSVW